MIKRRLFPHFHEVAIFAVAALICAAVVGGFARDLMDLAFAALAMPVFLLGAIMGLRRSPAWNHSPTTRIRSSTADTSSEI